VLSDLDKRDLIDRCGALAPREKDVLRGLANHRKPKEIARDLDISVNTVRGYLADARQKLGVVSMGDAALLFREYEAQQSTRRIWGDEFQRVSEQPAVVAASEHGLSEAPQFEHGEPGGCTADLDTENVSKLATKAPGTAHDNGPSQGTKAVLAEEGPGPDFELRLEHKTSGVHRRLGTLSPARWAGLIVVSTLAVIAAFGIGTVSLLGVFEVLQQIGGPHR